jgi:transposase
MRIEVLGGLEQRRRWPQDDKARIVEETLAPGAKVTEVARRNGVAASLVFTWRRQARTAERVVPCFAPVQIAAAVETGEETSKPSSDDDRRMRQLPAARNGLIEIDLGNRELKHIALGKSGHCPCSVDRTMKPLARRPLSHRSPTRISSAPDGSSPPGRD